ncbi:Nramp family divalent metal transporter [Psychroflexus sediminis]|uniref:Mn2+ and Fe2+ transporters of the NRAMP family n=1 Tax=Psychroflexus sediminis TaxID=470826 RepID=A0A1G7V5J3_9FLAO|nr:Nramp family divalent metal transporter [Psychroflexus sediminis]SDG55155.1 Mn2+ and Fe2+ transporters of the NRAMP family [Psychroflexus sediminis]
MKGVLKHIGPGFLLAGAAIGVSHLVQATRAGADYGVVLIFAIIIACLTKYPFMEFGSRYAATTGKNLIEGYKILGRWYVNVFALITVSTMFIIQAAVTIVSAGLAEYLFGFGWSNFTWSLILLLLCILILLIGKYKKLDVLMKIVVSFLTISTLFSVIIAAFQVDFSTISFNKTSNLWTLSGMGFVIALMGWMPIPIDASVWHSIWIQEKSKQTQQQPSIKEAGFDFNLGYLSAALLGILFFLMGLFLMNNSDISFASSSVAFSGQLIEMYAQTLGEWSRVLIAFIAFVTMFSTTLTVTDAFPRVMSKLTQKDNQSLKETNAYRIFIIGIPMIALMILYALKSTFTVLVDFASGLSFLASPVLAWFNLKLMTHKKNPIRMSSGYLLFSKICLFLLICFGLLYIVYEFTL